MKVKICGVTNPKDAELAVEAGAHYVGVIIGAKSPRLIPPERSKEIASILPSHVKLVGVVDARKELDLDLILRSSVRVVQLHWASYQSYKRALELLKPYSVSVALASPSFKDWPLERLEVEYLLVDVKDHEKKAEEVGRARPLAKTLGIAGGLNPNNLRDVLRGVKVDMVDVSSGVEKVKGKKDPEMVRAFVSSALGLPP
ncbi:hypothetical protein IPA_06865 [Ignicoccus pacificus DSM 13166]|uniref:N-(5'-phosphoribosyl)anthranilate isomerase n=1 Tax=Ignicoccus pacificus DSM 13166 TaxID=940294 RepID=A0A977PLL6_9CREN|nr:hypothetical protein IPA_06865 [Ignicoccus pacificus DSM 13166]